MLGLLLLAGCTTQPKTAALITAEKPIEIPIETQVTSISPTESKPKQALSTKCKLPNKKFGIYVTNHSQSYRKDKFAKIVKQTQSMGFNQIAVSVLYGGRSAVKTDSLVFPNHTFLEKEEGRDLFAEIQENSNLCAIAFAEWGTRYPFKSDLMLRYPEFFLANNKGERFEHGDGVKFAFLNILNENVKKSYLDYIRSLASNPNINVIQLDDHLAIGSSFGYNPEFIKGFNEFLVRNKIDFKGNKSKPDPKDLHWIKFRTQVVTNFFAQIVQAVNETNKEIEVTIVSGELRFMKDNYHQDFHQFTSKGAESIGVQAYGIPGKRNVASLLKREKNTTSIALFFALGKEIVPQTVLKANMDAVIANGNSEVWLFGHQPIYDGTEHSRAQQKFLKSLVVDYYAGHTAAAKTANNTKQAPVDHKSQPNQSVSSNNKK